MAKRNGDDQTRRGPARSIFVAVALGVFLCIGACGDSGADNPVAGAKKAPATAPPAPVVVDLEIKDPVVGTGVEARTGETIDVHYTGWLFDPKAVSNRGAKFDSSHDRGKPLSFQLGAGRVIRGWEEGIVGMKVGGKRVLVIPAAMAYGARGAAGGKIPPHSVLVFEVDLVRVR